MSDWFPTILHWTTRSIELAGIAAIVIGTLVATLTFVTTRWHAKDKGEAFHTYRSSLGRSILLGLELLVAADIIATVAIEPTLESVLVLGGIVLIRTFLSLSLEVEINGRWPWHGHDRSKGGQLRGTADQD